MTKDQLCLLLVYIDAKLELQNATQYHQVLAAKERLALALSALKDSVEPKK